MQWLFDDSAIDWHALAELYRVAPLGDKKPDNLRRTFAHSMFKCFITLSTPCVKQAISSRRA